MNASPLLKKSIAMTLLISFCSELIVPNAAWALTSGPTQPEVHGFEPVSTTDMVDLFTGDFTYNIPLMDVEGYPLNISYHSGGGVEEESSWVGLGWSLNPGVMNRAVRGLPDDFKDEKLEKIVKIKKERNLRAGVAVGLEVAGLSVLKSKKKIKLSASAGLYVNSSNYRGMSAGARVGLGLDLFGYASAGVNLGINSQTGGDIDYNAGVRYMSSEKLSKEEAMGVGVTVSSGYNTRSGYKDVRINGGANFERTYQAAKGYGAQRLHATNHFASNTIPIGLQNFVPVITNRSTLTAIDVALQLGGEAFWLFPNGDLSMMVSELKYDTDATRSGFGYLYMDGATEEDIVDFTRDKDGMFNETMSYLPLANMTYDVYSATAQGAGGMFRPYRNDFGSVYDPLMEPSQNESHSINVEAGLGNIVEVGGDYSGFFTDIQAGPWKEVAKKFWPKEPNSLYEDVYFKQAGELTEVDAPYLDQINDEQPLALNASNVMSFPNKRSFASGRNRVARGNMFYYFTAEEASNPEVSTSDKLYNYTDVDGMKDGPNVERQAISRYDGAIRKKHQLSEIVQLTESGTRYVYGLPAMNNIQVEQAFSVEKSRGAGVNANNGLVKYRSDDNTPNNGSGIEQYYSGAITPGYAHSYFLTSVLNHDYVDVTGNGITDDDLGGFTKFNYSRKSDDYRWRTAPDDSAQYNPGFYSDSKDDKGYLQSGSKELWYLHNIETKNYVAEFYTSMKDDALGYTNPIISSATSPYYATHGYGQYTTSAAPNTNRTYKLDSIVLYNKHDRFINKENAEPIKSVIFSYDYTLCKNTTNSVATTTKGKLTLKRIYTRYGRSDKNMISPYQFSYGANYDYSTAAKNRWGGYKPSDPNLPNWEFPYVNQTDAANDQYAAAWQMNKIILPSGGEINIEYESDDYAYVQDQRAMEMYKIEGVGKTEQFIPNTAELYTNPKSPNSYIYFKKRPGVTIADVKKAYLENQDNLSFNFYIDVANKSQYELVHGYGAIEKMGECPGSPDYCYIKLKTRTPKGTDASVSPMTYIGMNLARNNLPHILYPGSDPESSAFINILKGLAAAIDELKNIFKNPVQELLKKNVAKRYLVAKSMIRLHSPALKKKGGGSRVKSIVLSDSWSSMIPGEPSAGFGKSYDYTLIDPVYGVISSGVASYEPLVGGDELPARKPVPYKLADGSNIPPNDPIELYQEDPVGETLFPSPVVGYRQVQVESIHAETARSAQTVERYEFYTAKDFPIKVESTPITMLENKKDIKLLNTNVKMKAVQAYAITMNDMHGKPKANYKEQILSRDNPLARKLIASNVYEYNVESPKRLGNKVNTLVYDPAQTLHKSSTATVGKEIDVTIDTRCKTEKTHTTSLAVNGNFSWFGIIGLPIATVFPGGGGDYQKEFRSMVTTKVIQEYGIISSVESTRDGAKTTLAYQYYNPETGHALITKVNNEFDDPEYETSIPAYWAHKRMGPAYYNIGYEETGRSIEVQPDGVGYMKAVNPTSYALGDELMLTYSYGGEIRNFKVWVLGDYKKLPGEICYIKVAPRKIENTAVWPAGVTLNNIATKVVRSGRKNRLSENVQTILALSDPMKPMADGQKRLDLGAAKAINTEVQTYAENRVLSMPGFTASKYNDYVSGLLGIYRPAETYAYLASRNYAGHNRNDGTYELYAKYIYSSDKQDMSCYGFVRELLIPGPITNWKMIKTTDAYTTWGNEIQSTDALAIPSSAVYGYNHQLPVAVASNAPYDNILSEGFEDYKMLYMQHALLNLISPFKSFFSWTPAGTTELPYQYFNITDGAVKLIDSTAHTGVYSMLVPAAGTTLTINKQSSTAYRPFNFRNGQSFIINCWVKNAATPPSVIQRNAGMTAIDTRNMVKKGNLIEGWQNYEVVFPVDITAEKVELVFPAGACLDDIRAFPATANMKAFVYHPYTQKLMAILDENNYATFYEYDKEGLLIRVKKETEKGVLTVQESAQSTRKAQ